MKGNHEADYLLFLEGKAVGVLEAKREERALSDVVAEQAENYTHELLSKKATSIKVLITPIMRRLAMKLRILPKKSLLKFLKIGNGLG